MEERQPAAQIGTLNERPLHAALKKWAAEEGDRFEVPVAGYVVDIVRGDLLIEVQTGTTSVLKKKLNTLVRRQPVRLILPIARKKTIVRLDAAGKIVQSRVSPKRAGVADAFHELINLRGLLGDSNLSIDIVLIHMEEVRRPKDHPTWRKGWQVHERRLVEVYDSFSFHHPTDFLAIIPSDLAEPFTTADLAAATGQKRRLGQKVAYVLREMGALVAVGKHGNSILYRRNVHEGRSESE